VQRYASPIHSLPLGVRCLQVPEVVAPSEVTMATVLLPRGVQESADASGLPCQTSHGRLLDVMNQGSERQKLGSCRIQLCRDWRSMDEVC